MGDRKGIIRRLPYLKDLGVGILWLSPVYVSPFVDNGYDIADYRDISPVFGTLGDFDALLQKAKAMGLEIIVDLVVNHCSSEHELFKKALADPYGPESRYFYFVKGKNGLPPDNLRSYFGGSVWEKVKGCEDLWYLHYFARQQPDFNWYNPELRQKIFAMMNWWLERGVAGFRVDAIMNIAKDLEFKGLPPDDKDGLCSAGAMTCLHSREAAKFLKEMKEHTYGRCRSFTVGEAFGLHADDLKNIYGSEDGCFDSVFDFTAREMAEKPQGYYAFPKPSVKTYRDGNFTGQLQANEVGFLAPILENHDEPRAVSFYLKPHQHNPAGCKALATAFMFLRGIPFIYQGQEIGMLNTRFESIDEFRDLLAFDEYKKCLDHGLSESEALALLNLHSRDHGRTPMLWDDSEYAGFSDKAPWIRVSEQKAVCNVKAQLNDPDSVLNFYKKLIRLRRAEAHKECLTYGRFEPIELNDDELLAYKRVGDNEQAAVYVNFKDEAVTLAAGKDARALLLNRAGLCDGALTLEPLGSCVLLFK